VVRWHESPRTSLSYRTALTRPPDRKPHPTFLWTTTQQAAGMPRHLASCRPTRPTAKPSFSRQTISTLYRITTGHTFVSEYTQRFYRQHTPDQIACQCGKRVQTIEYVLMDCLRYDNARCKHLTVNGRLRNIPQMFSNPERVHLLLHFLEETGACAKPRAVWEPR
jgi:hypothetical protein